MAGGSWGCSTPSSLHQGVIRHVPGDCHQTGSARRVLRCVDRRGFEIWTNSLGDEPGRRAAEIGAGIFNQVAVWVERNLCADPTLVGLADANSPLDCCAI